MKAMINNKIYKINIIDNSYSATQCEVEILEGNFKGQRAIVSNTDIIIGKFTSKIEYVVSREEDQFDNYKKKITGREFWVTITTNNSIQNNEFIMYNLMEHIENNSDYAFHRCSGVEADNNKLTYIDSITVDDKDEYEEIKELYKEWKEGVK